MPKAAVYKYRRLLFRKGKIRLTKYLVMPPPAMNMCCFQQRKKLLLSGFIATAFDGGHISRPLLFCVYICHYQIEVRLLREQTAEQYLLIIS